ncbi:MAG TPA: cob(I)yrinic acid a,c-diamide adenosyltransferase [Devosia sp.]|nr:cob(I)yrinic acid a,c-diamide adenosyltransferase [Devosia sp.]
MVKLNKIYTRTGDDGTTALARGPRRNKNDIRVVAFGTVDEANAFIGQARNHAKAMPKIDAVLSRVQNDLFDLGADLATPGSDEGEDYPSLRITKAQIDWLENQIDSSNATLEPLDSFILPAGTGLSSTLHIARTIVRRAERDVVTLMAEEPQTSPETLAYLNRLSDLLFVMARLANSNGRADIKWVPGRHTGKRQEKL